MPIKITRRHFVAGTAVAAAAIASSSHSLWAEKPGALVEESVETLHLPTKKLRGYGNITAAHRKMNGSDGPVSVTHITCDSPEKALLVQAKYLSDCGLIAASSVDTVEVGSKNIPIRQTPLGGAIAAYAEGPNVLIFAADSKSDLAGLLSIVVPQSARSFSFNPRVKVPMYLDRFDKHGLLIYYAVFSRKGDDPQYDFTGDFRWLRDNGPLGAIVWTTPSGDDTAEGLTDDANWDWIEHGLQALDLPLHINISHSDTILWLGNRYRDETMIKAPQFLGGYYGVAHDSLGCGQISWNSDAGEAAMLGILQHTVRRYAKNPNIVGWLEPHAETDEFDQMLFLEYGPVADKGIQRYLRETHKSLSVVSQRWFDDPNHLTSWDQIKAPEMGEFCGYGTDAIDLRTEWRIHYVPAPDGHFYDYNEARGLPSPPPIGPIPAEWFQPGFDDSSWDKLVAPGNDKLRQIPWSPLIYRRAIDIPADWRAKNQKIWLYVWDVYRQYNDEIVVYVNGQKIDKLPQGSIYSVFDVSRALKAGQNSIILGMPRGIICYRTYLTPIEPAQFPQLGLTRNAIWADFVGWLTWGVERQSWRGAEMIRQIDPDRPINYMACGTSIGPMKKVLMQYGGHYHDTGAMAGFMDEFPSLIMRGSGHACTAEPGNGPPNRRELQAFFGRWFAEGVNAVHYFQTLGEIIWNPDVLPVFEKNKSMYETIGKYHVPFAEVAFLHSSRNERLTSSPWSTGDNMTHGGYWGGFDFPWSLWSFCPRDLLAEEDFPAGNASKYKIIIDMNTSFMTDEVLADIAQYVEDGGVFCAYYQTGRHTDIEPDSWPITKLTGYSMAVLEQYPTGATIKPAPNQTMFKDPYWDNPRRTGGLGLKKESADCKDLMTWSDGTVAIGIRQHGKGYFMHCGVNPGGGDRDMILREMVSYFDVSRVPAVPSNEGGGLHYRHFISNSGLVDLFVFFNESDKPNATDLNFLPGVHQASLNDLRTGESITIARDPAGDSIKNIQLDPMQTIIYVGPRKDVAASPVEWLILQRGWWQGAGVADPAAIPPPETNQKFSVDMSEDWSFKPADGLTDVQAAALTLPTLSEASWERRDLGVWSIPDHVDVKRAVMRRKFTVPAHWTDGTINFCWANGGPFLERGRVFMDGVLLRDWCDGIGLHAVDDLLKPGTTHLLAADVKSTISLAGITGTPWLYYLPHPQATQDLSGEWTSYFDAIKNTGPQTLPGKTSNSAYLSRMVTFDPAQSNRNVLVYVETDRPIFGVLINGHLINHSFRWNNTWFIINITPLVKFGELNLLELAGQQNDPDSRIDKIEIRYYDKGVYP